MKTTWSDIESSIRETLTRDAAHPLLIDSFTAQARRVFDGVSGLIPGRDIRSADGIADYSSLSDADRSTGERELSKVVMIKLNGGLGTGMGLERAKSLLPVKNGLTFLDIIARQVLYLRREFQVNLPLLLMTSFSTDRDTLEALADYPGLSGGQSRLPLTFRQNRVPKLMADSLLPAQSTDVSDKAWCPPGHGDLYAALTGSGLLDKLIQAQYRYAFISNADNLGAVIDPSIVGFMAQRNLPFLMEVTDRTEADKKGGHVARATADGRLLLRESAQCPPDETAAFQDITTYRFFNTNNLWVDLVALHRMVKETGKLPELALIVNRKPLDPRDETSPPVLQLETAMGAAISSFPGAEAMRVPRTRFAPVKTTDDLLALWSDAYELTPAMHIRLSGKRTLAGPPVIKLDPKYFKKIDDFSARFPDGAPSLIDCRSLVVNGDHLFRPEVRFTGDCRLDHTAGGQAVIVKYPPDA